MAEKLSVGAENMFSLLVGASVASDSASPPSDIVTAIGKLFITLTLVGVSVYLWASGGTVPPELLTLTVTIVSLYTGQRASTSTGTK